MIPDNSEEQFSILISNDLFLLAWSSTCTYLG